MARQPRKSARSLRLCGRETAKTRKSEMKHKGPSLTDAVKAVASGDNPSEKRTAASSAEPSLTQAMKNVASRTRSPPTTRKGRKGIVIYVDQDVAAAIRRLASDYNTTVQALGEKAFKFLFEKLGDPSLA